MVLPAEMSAVHPAGDQRVMARHHDDSAGCSLEPGTERIDDLRLSIGGTIRGRVPRLGSGMEPPLGIDQQQPQPSELYPLRSRTSVPGLDPNCSVARRIYERLLAPSRLPPLLAVLGPVVVAEHEET